MVGANLAAGHHDCRFDFDEEGLVLGVALIGSVARELLKVNDTLINFQA